MSNNAISTISESKIAKPELLTKLESIIVNANIHSINTIKPKPIITIGTHGLPLIMVKLITANKAGKIKSKQTTAEALYLDHTTLNSETCAKCNNDQPLLWFKRAKLRPPIIAVIKANILACEEINGVIIPWVIVGASLMPANFTCNIVNNSIDNKNDQALKNAESERINQIIGERK